MTKQKMIYLGVGVLVGVVLADKIRSLPVANKLPTL